MRIVTVVGARPQFIKAAPVSRCLSSVGEEVLVHTGQHYDVGMSKVFFEELGIPEPAVNLGVGSGSHGAQTARMLEGLETVITRAAPDLVLVYGDTNSTLAGALAAAKLHIPVAHVEAGLRSFNRRMPEEINRVVADHVADHLFCPTETSVRHLHNEGIFRGVELVGDVMVDALQMVQDRLSLDRVVALGVEPPYYAATLHRAENIDDPDRLRSALRVLAMVPGSVVIPVHPRTQRAMEVHEFRWPDNVQPLPPVGYVDMLSLLRYAEALLTDSGGLQKESVLLGTPCITLRSETEWVETVEAGMNVVVDLDMDKAVEALRDTNASASDVARIFPPGASQRIAEALSG